MTHITTPRLGEADQADSPRSHLEPEAPSTAPAQTDARRRRQLSPLLALGIAAAAATLGIVAIVTDDVGSEPTQPATVPVIQPALDPVPDGVPCPESPVRGQTLC